MVFRIFLRKKGKWTLARQHEREENGDARREWQ